MKFFFFLVISTILSFTGHAAPLEHKFAKLPTGVNLHYVTAGAGPQMLFVHGFPEFWYGWKKQLEHFSKDHQTVAFDMRGYNLSSKPKKLSDYTLEPLVQDLRALVIHLGDKRPTLVAHDWGGIVAWAFAIRYPEMIERLVIINSPHPAVFVREIANNPKQKAGLNYIKLLRRRIAPWLLSLFNYKILRTVVDPLVEKGHLTKSDKAEYLRAWSVPSALKASLMYYRANDFKLTDYPSFRVNVPTLVIWGEKDDKLLTGNLNRLDEYVPDLKVLRVPDGSHWVVHEKSDLVNGSISNFMKH